MVRSLSRSDAFFLEYCLQQRWVSPCITIPHGAAGAVARWTPIPWQQSYAIPVITRGSIRWGSFQTWRNGVWIRKSCPETGWVWFYNRSIDVFVVMMYHDISWFLFVGFCFFGTCFIWPGHSLTLTFLSRDQPSGESLRASESQKWMGVVDVWPPGFSGGPFWSKACFKFEQLSGIFQIIMTFCRSWSLQLKKHLKRVVWRNMFWTTD